MREVCTGEKNLRTVPFSELGRETLGEPEKGATFFFTVP